MVCVSLCVFCCRCCGCCCGFFAFHRLVFQIIFWIKGYIVWHDVAVSTKQLADIMDGRNIIQVSFKLILKTQTQTHRQKCTYIPPHAALGSRAWRSIPFHLISFCDVNAKRTWAGVSSGPGYFIATSLRATSYMFMAFHKVHNQVNGDIECTIQRVKVCQWVLMCVCAYVCANATMQSQKRRKGKKTIWFCDWFCI